MRSKNSKAHTRSESEHLANVKRCECSVCDHSAPSEAHHIIQGDHYTAVALCDDCHTGPQGIHGDGTLWRIKFNARDLGAEVRALNITLKRIAENDNDA